MYAIMQCLICAALSHTHNGIVCIYAFIIIYIQVVKFDYGKQDENPIDEMSFYAKGELDEAFKVSIEQVYREAFCEIKLNLLLYYFCFCRYLSCYLTRFKKQLFVYSARNEIRRALVLLLSKYIATIYV